MFHKPVSIESGADCVHIDDENISACVKDVYVALLTKKKIELPLKDQLSYLLYKYHTNHRPDEPEETTELLLQTTRWFEHPYMNLDLAYHYRSTGDVPLAV